MPDAHPWNELSRAQQRVLARLWAGGSCRGQDRVTVIGLVLMGYVEGEHLTPAGERLCSDALGEIVNRLHENYPGLPSEALRRRFPHAKSDAG